MLSVNELILAWFELPVMFLLVQDERREVSCSSIPDFTSPHSACVCVLLLGRVFLRHLKKGFSRADVLSFA